jgi:hypothetical protein
MTTKSYVFLFCGVLVLLMVAAILTNVLLKLSVSGPPVAPAPQGAQEGVRKYTPAVSETYIEAKENKKSSGITKPAGEKKQTSIQGEAVKKTPKFVGVVVAVRGYVFATGTGGQMRALTVNSRIYLQEQIETGPAASAKIKFDDGTIVSEGENSAMLVDKYLYNPQNRAETVFGLCFLKGACHLITGLITEIAPQRFKVRTRLATIGIRGCELAFRSRPEEDDIYVLALSGKEKVRIETTSDGSQMMGVPGNEELPLADSKRKNIDVVEAGEVYSITKGQGVQERAVSLEETSRIISESTGLAPALHNVQLSRDGAVFTIQPEKRPSATDKDKIR